MNNRYVTSGSAGGQTVLHTELACGCKYENNTLDTRRDTADLCESHAQEARARGIKTDTVSGRMAAILLLAR